MKKLAIFTAMVCCFVMLAACAQSEAEDASGMVPSSTSSLVESSSLPHSTSSSKDRSSSGSRPTTPSTSSSSSSQAPPTSSGSRDSSSSSRPAASNPPVIQTPAPPASSDPPAQPAPAPAPTQPAPTPEPPPPPQPSSPYAYPFDVAQIQSDMIAWGQAAGMTHEPGTRTPDNSSWDNPITASESFQGDILAQKLKEYVQFYTSASWQGYGNEPVTHFTIYVSGTTFYVLH